MITLFDGKPGAGKSYRAVYHIWHNKDKYSAIYTNIDGFKYQDNIKKYTDSWFLDILENAKIIYDDESKNDSDIHAYLYEIGFLNAPDEEHIKPVLIVIDEAEQQFGDKNALWQWFLTYHRHLFIDAILIAVDANLIYYLFRPLIQEIYHAMPESSMLFKLPFTTRFKKDKFKYQQHQKLPIRDGKFGTFIGNTFLSKDEEIFSLYKSGDHVRAKSIFSRFYWIIAIALLLLGFLVYSVFNSLFNNDHVSQKQIQEDAGVITRTTSKTKGYRRTQRSSPRSYNQKRYIGLTCIGTRCTNTSLKIKVELDHLKDLLKNTDSKFLSSSRLGSDFTTVYLLVSSDFIELFKERTNEKSSQGFNLLH